MSTHSMGRATLISVRQNKSKPEVREIKCDSSPAEIVESTPFDLRDEIMISDTFILPDAPGMARFSGAALVDMIAKIDTYNVDELMFICRGESLSRDDIEDWKLIVARLRTLQSSEFGFSFDYARAARDFENGLTDAAMDDTWSDILA